MKRHRKNCIILGLLLAFCLPAGTFFTAALNAQANRVLKNTKRTTVKKSTLNRNKKNSRNKKDTAEETEPQNHQFNLEIPWISTNYIQPQVMENEPVKIGFYVTDWHQSEYRFMDDSHRFDATLKIRKKNKKSKKAPKEKVYGKKDLKAGDHEFEAGTFTEGEYQIELSAVDKHGRKSTVLFHEFRVLTKDHEITEKETFRVTEKDLAKYNISNKGDLGIFHFFEAKGLNGEKVAAIAQEIAQEIKVPSGKYVIIAGAEKYDPEEHKNHRGAKDCPVPEWLPNSWSNGSRQIIYAPDYDKEKVEQDSIRTGEGLNNLLEKASKSGYRKVVLPKGTYRISNTTTIKVPSGMTLDLNGAVIKLNQFAGCHGLQIQIKDGIDTHVVNGIVEGDYFEHDYENSEKNSEWVCGVGMDGESKYSSYERILVRYVTGYGVTNGINGLYGKKTSSVKGFTPGTIDEETGKPLPDAGGLWVSAPVDISAYLEDGGHIAVSKFLGYQGMTGSDWSLRYHFYDSGNKYLETIYGRQYRRVRIPERAKFMRVTVYAFGGAPADDALTAHLFRLPWNSWYKNIFIHNVRCVGMAPAGMYNFRVENCSFVRSGESSAKCAFDAEDGWDMMQDVLFIRNQFIKNPLNEFVCCAGHNFIFEDNEGRLLLWDRANAYVARNNLWRGASYGAAGSRSRTGLVRIYNNTYTGAVKLGNGQPPKKVEKLDPETVADAALAAIDPAQQVTPKELSGNVSRNAAPTPWFITMKDAGNASLVSCGPWSKLTGANLKDIKVDGIVSLLACTLSREKRIPLGNATLFKSRLLKFTATVNKGILAVGETLLKDGEIGVGADGDGNSAVVIRNSDLRNITFPMAFWALPVDIILENCTVKNDSEPLITAGVYSIGQIKFVNCEIDTGSAPVIKIFDMRQHRSKRGQELDEKEGTIRFENCTILNKSKGIVSIETKKGSESGSTKRIILTDKENQHQLESVLPKKPDHWEYRFTKAPDSGINMPPRGRADKNDKDLPEDDDDGKSKKKKKKSRALPRTW